MSEWGYKYGRKIAIYYHLSLTDIQKWRFVTDVSGRGYVSRRWFCRGFAAVLDPISVIHETRWRLSKSTVYDTNRVALRNTYRHIRELIRQTGETMHNVLQILRRDFKRLVTVPAAW